MKDFFSHPCVVIFGCWLLSVLVLGGALATVVYLGVHYLGWAAAPWLTFWSWKSPSLIAFIVIALISAVLGFGFAFMFVFMTAMAADNK